MEQVGGEQFLNVKLDSVNKAEYIYAQAVKNEHLLTKERVAKWFIERYVFKNQEMSLIFQNLDISNRVV